MLSEFWIVFLSILGIGGIVSIFIKDPCPFELSFILCCLMGLAKLLLSPLP